MLFRSTNGAFGARMIGGGFGGSAIALVKSEDLEPVKEKISKAFASANFKTPRSSKCIGRYQWR